MVRLFLFNTILKINQSNNNRVVGSAISSKTISVSLIKSVNG
jgi:hypothetical protein